MGMTHRRATLRLGLATVRVLVIGSGAREHALLLALRNDPDVESLAVAPGNAGTAAIADQHDVDITSGDDVVALAQKIGADLVVIGPEVPLVLGVADAVRAAGIACFGPTKEAARIEGSKAFAKDVMAAAGVRTAEERDRRQPRAPRRGIGPVRARAPATRRGWSRTTVWPRARASWSRPTGTPRGRTRPGLLDAGHPVLLESFLDGPEVSLFCVVDGETVVPLLPAQDFKRVGDGDTGPNTGGMGAYAPLPWLPDDVTDAIVNDIVKPVAAELGSTRTARSRGCCTPGLAITSNGPAVVEFNCRFGDPETQSVLALHRIATGSAAARRGHRSARRAARRCDWRDGAAVTVVLAAENYPGRPRVGDVITGAEADGVLHAGTARRDDGAVVSSGGRVLSVVGTGSDLAAAREDAYAPDQVDPVAGQPLSQRHRAGRRRGPDQGLTAMPSAAARSRRSRRAAANSRRRRRARPARSRPRAGSAAGR